MSLNNLAERLAEAETDESPPPRNIRKSAYSALHQSHLPKLDSSGIVCYDKRSKMVSLGPRARDIEPYMEVTTRYGITWETYYRRLAQSALLVVFLSELDIWLFSPLPPVLILGVFLSLVVASTAYQLWADRWRLLRRFS